MNTLRSIQERAAWSVINLLFYHDTRRRVYSLMGQGSSPCEISEEAMEEVVRLAIESK